MALVNSGSGLKGYAKLKQLFAEILKQVEIGKNDAEIVSALSANERFSFLKAIEPTLATKRRGFDTGVKSAAFLKEALENSVRCRICDCHIHPNAMTIDHIKEKRNAGTGSFDNAQVSHPYCNTTYKDLKANEFRTP